MKYDYDGLFQLLEERGISKTHLMKKLEISSATMAKFGKSEQVSLNVLANICRELHCEISDIIKIEKENNNKLLETFLEEKNMQLKGGIYHYTQTNFAYNSNRIEGGRLTEDQTRYIYETHTIVQVNNEPININDTVETINHFTCFDYILEHVYDELSEAFIKEIHKILKTGTTDSRKEWFRIGEYKAKPNMVGNSKTTPPSKVKGDMARLIINYNDIQQKNLDDIIEFHHAFEKIHPFQDGNGRVGRLIMFKECLKNQLIPFIINESHKLYYYQGLKEYENEKGYLRDTCLSAQDKFQEIIQYFEKI